MDLSKAEKTLSKLEENSEKVAEVTKSVQKFEKISDKLENLPDDIKKNTSSIELRIVDVEKQISKENEKLITLIKDEVKLLKHAYKECGYYAPDTPLFLGKSENIEDKELYRG